MLSKFLPGTGFKPLRGFLATNSVSTLINNNNKTISTSENAQNQPEHRPGAALPTHTTKKQSTVMNKAQRAIATYQNLSLPISTQTVAADDDVKDFKALFPEIVRELCQQTKNEYSCKEAASWLAKALEYNVPHGKMNRGLLAVSTFKHLAKSEDLTPENLKLANYLGWCVEMLQSVFLISDDIMDNGTTRRGQPCWYKTEGVGLIAFNDALMIESSIYKILKSHFKHLQCYTELIELFHEITLITTFGQSQDILNSNKSVDNFTMDNYKAIVINKTAYYTFYLPVALAMHLSGIKDKEIFRQAKVILLEMGHFYQIQDDFLDCFSSQEIKGKTGNDIEDNKCSWLAVVAMQRVNKEEREIMRECYGHNDPEKVRRVKSLYEQLGLPQTYTMYEEEFYKLIQTHIQQTSRGIPHQVFLELLEKIYRRTS